MKLSSIAILSTFCILMIQTLFGSPVVTSVNPYFGSSAGGTVVFITGSGFTGVTTVNFGTTPAAFVFNSDSSITAISPAHTPEVISVTVTTPSGSSPSTPSSYFVYQGDWQVIVNDRLDASATVIDTITNTVVATIPTGSQPTSVQITPDGTKAYVVNRLSNNITVIDRATNTVIATIPVGSSPFGLATTPDSTKAYVTNINTSDVSVISTVTNSVIATVPVGPNPEGLAITPDGSKVYVLNDGDQSVSVISTASDTVIATVSVGSNPITIVITPDGTKAYVTNEPDDTVSVIDIASNTVITTIPVGIDPEASAISPDGSVVYVANNTSNNVSVISTASNTVIATIPVGIAPIAVAFTPDGTRAYVVTGANVQAIDTTSLSVVATITFAGPKRMIVITPDGTRAYVTVITGTVTVIDTTTNTIIATPAAGTGPDSEDMMPDQAPLARFTITTGLLGSPSTFDASGSISPVGTISNYFWNFGDGTTLSTSQPIVSHIYTSPGNFFVTLTVTNSAGTSNTQIYIPFAVAFGYEVQGILKNGGPSAVSTQLISIISTLSPSNLQGVRVKNKFLTQTEFIDVLTWNPPVGGNSTVAYRIFANAALTELLGTVPANGKLLFKVHNRREHRTYEYFVVSVDQAGNQSAPAAVVVNGYD